MKNGLGKTAPSTFQTLVSKDTGIHVSFKDNSKIEFYAKGGNLNMKESTVKLN
jgi:hypothetical protein